MADMSDVDTMAKGDVRCVNAVWRMKKEARDGLAVRSRSRLDRCGAILIAVSEVAVEVRSELTPRVKVPLA